MKRKWKVLVSAPYVQEDIDRLGPLLISKGLDITVPDVKERLTEEQLLEIIGEYDGVVAGDDKFTPRVFEAAKKLKVVSKWGIGIDSFDKEAAKKHGVVIRNTPGAFRNQVADSILAYMLAFARQVSWMDQDIKAGGWKKRPLVSLNESVVGVIGLGNTGKETVKRLYGFGAKILGCDIVEISPDFIKQHGVEMTTKDDLLRRSDFVTLNCDLNATSHHIIGKAEFSLMKPNAVLVNCARGPLIDEPALVEALRKGMIAGAGLDVFEAEPLPLDSPLRKMPNVLCAPHNSNGAKGERERIHTNTINNLMEELNKHA